MFIFMYSFFYVRDIFTIEILNMEKQTDKKKLNMFFFNTDITLADIMTYLSSLFLKKYV